MGWGYLACSSPSMLRLPVTFTLALASLALFAAPAQARTAPCRVDAPVGPKCHVFTGKMTHVADGDGLYVDVRGDGTRRTQLVRVTGIQAMELTRYAHKPSRRRGACHAREATRALERLVRRAKSRVRLAAQDLGRTDRGRRVRRHLAVRIGGRWVDAGLAMLQRGHALWLPNSGEWAWNALYARAARDAAATGRNLHDDDFCGAGPGAGAPLELHVNWDADGSDLENVNGEWVRVRSTGDADVPLGGWWIRDSTLRRFTFPAGATLRAGSSVLLRVGRGQADAGTFFWGLPGPVFENAKPERGIGDGAYLFDTQGDLRAHELYGVAG